MTSSTLEQEFDTQFIRISRSDEYNPERTNVPLPTEQVLFHPERDWRWDRAWIDKLVCLDLHGGGFKGGEDNPEERGAHHRELGMANDLSKQNAAVALGWRVVLANTYMIRNDPFSVVECILSLLKQPVLSVDAEYAMWLARIRNLTHVGDSIENNGIAVERLRKNGYFLSLSSGTFTIGGKNGALAEVQKDVLDFILRGVSAASTPKIIARGNDRRPTAQTSLF